MVLDLRTLRYFVQVAEFGNLSRAARALNIVQPALSQRISGLEGHLGVQLFVRSPHGMDLTDEGRRLVVKARDLLDRADAIEEEIGAASGPLHGSVRLGLPAAAANVLVEPLMGRLGESHPGILLRIDEARTVTLLECLAAGQYDIAVTASLGGSGRIQGDLLATETLHLVGAADSGLGDEVSFDEVARRRLVLSSRTENRANMLDREAERIGTQLNVALESTSLATSKRLIARAGMFGIMTWSAAADGIAQASLIAAKIVDPVFPRPLFLCQLPDRRHSRATQVVARAIETVSAELVESGVLR